MTIDQMRDWIARHKEMLIGLLLDGSYRPQPIRGVRIPKPGGKGMRQLGIPTVIDRLVQQAILQVLDPTFSESIYGFRIERGAHDALLQASKYVESGRAIVVDMDLARFFGRVNHDILLSRLARRIADKRLLRIIRRFLVALSFSRMLALASYSQVVGHHENKILLFRTRTRLEKEIGLPRVLTSERVHAWPCSFCPGKKNPAEILFCLNRVRGTGIS